MLVAWPLGIILAVVWLFIPWPWASKCPSGQACALEPSSWSSTIIWLCFAFGPGVWATRRWWRGDAPAA
jgi:uncharacterized membrane protein YphA (DoxX/SURF4 family)